MIDSTILIDYLRGRNSAIGLIEQLREQAPLHGSEITRVEILAGMRPTEEIPTRAVLSGLFWHPIDSEIAERAGALGRQWLPSHSGIDAADLAIAATAQILGLPLYTSNIRHFPMFPGLQPPY